jgi:DNA-binding transcriptional ArsR family regulator
MDAIFRALADGGRRRILDALFERDGQTLTELTAQVDYTRQALSKHLAILEQARLVLTRFEGRAKRHYLNPIPIQEIAERWLAKYSNVQLSAVTALKLALEQREPRRKRRKQP